MINLEAFRLLPLSREPDSFLREMRRARRHLQAMQSSKNKGLLKEFDREYLS